MARATSAMSSGPGSGTRTCPRPSSLMSNSFELISEQRPWPWQWLASMDSDKGQPFSRNLRMHAFLHELISEANLTSVLGLVQHLAEAERYWFGHHLAGTAAPPSQPPPPRPLPCPRRRACHLSGPAAGPLTLQGRAGSAGNLPAAGPPAERHETHCGGVSAVSGRTLRIVPVELLSDNQAAAYGRVCRVAARGGRPRWAWSTSATS
jgi:hypothetical protein